MQTSSDPFLFRNCKYTIDLKIISRSHFYLIKIFYLENYAKWQISLPLSQLTFTCSKSTIKTAKKDVKYVQS